MKCPASSFFINFSVLLWILLTASQVGGQQKTHNYDDFPPLYKFDDYDSCIGQQYESLSSTYCIVYAEVKEQNSSSLWQRMISHYGEYPFRYRHDHLFFGVCIKRCEMSVNSELTADDIIENEITDYFGKVHKRPLDKEFREKYHNFVHTCLNQEFQQKYNLSLRTYIEYCEARPDFTNGAIKDPLENLFYKIMGIIVILNILSSLYDYCLKLQQAEECQNNDFYKMNLQQTVPRFLTCFSICRNYYRLIQPYLSETAKDFRFLDGFRSICMMLALFGHIFFSEYQHIANPHYYEKSAKDENNLWILNTTIIIETYFVMSGLLLFIKFQQSRLVTEQTSWKQFIIIYLKLLVFRYIRFLPSVALLILVNATVLPRLQNGPFWRHITEPVYVFSREKSWKNLLMINNFSHKESASHHTWYIAADWQLFALYLLVIMVVSKHPKCKKFLYAILSISSFVIPFSISYGLKLQPAFIIKPESYRYAFFKDIDVYYKIYTQFYTNLFGYMFGIICGEIYLKYTRKDEIRKWLREKPKYIIAAHSLAILAFFLFWLGPILDVRGPSVWSALYAGLHRNLWIMFICGIPLLMMSCNCGCMLKLLYLPIRIAVPKIFLLIAGIAYEFCCLPIFRFLARLSFQVYIWHLTIIYLLNGYQRQPYYVNNFHFFCQFVVLYCVSNALAFLIALFIEYPIAQSVQVLQSRSTRLDKSGKKSS